MPFFAVPNWVPHHWEAIKTTIIVGAVYFCALEAVTYYRVHIESACDDPTGHRYQNLGVYCRLSFWQAYCSIQNEAYAHLKFTTSYLQYSPNTKVPLRY